MSQCASLSTPERNAVASLRRNRNDSSAPFGSTVESLSQSPGRKAGPVRSFYITVL